MRLRIPKCSMAWGGSHSSLLVPSPQTSSSDLSCKDIERAFAPRHTLGLNHLPKECTFLPDRGGDWFPWVAVFLFFFLPFLNFNLIFYFYHFKLDVYVGLCGFLCMNAGVHWGHMCSMLWNRRFRGCHSHSMAAKNPNLEPLQESVYW